MTEFKVTVSYEIGGVRAESLEFQWGERAEGRDFCRDVIAKVMAKEQPDLISIEAPIVNMPHGQRPVPQLANYELMKKYSITKLTYEINGITYLITD